MRMCDGTRREWELGGEVLRCSPAEWRGEVGMC